MIGPNLSEWALLKRSLVVFLMILAVIAGTLSFTRLGRGEEEAETPSACLASSDAYLDALRAAPEPVLLEGSTPISDCVPADQDPAELGQAGEQMIAAATVAFGDAA